MQTLPNGLNALVAFKQFVVYKLTPSTTRVGKTDKLPVDYRTGALPASGSGVESIWCDADTAIEYAAVYGDNYGVGFYFTNNDPFWFLDIDNCLSADGTQWSELAVSLMTTLNGAYLEVSQSGKGLHIIGSGVTPLHACKNTAYGLELYHEGRFVALTGIHASGDARVDMTHMLGWLVDSYFKPSDTVAVAWTDEPDPEWNGNVDDDELIKRALRSQGAGAAFGKRATFADLWNADVERLAGAFPDEQRDYDASSADAALAQHLAFWTGKDCERMLRLMQRSALVRDKWNRDDYMQRTILGACARQVEVLQDKRPVGTLEYDTPDGKPRVGESFLDGAKQAALFAGCVYVTTAHAVLVEGGMLLKPEQFRVKFGGFSFNMDIGNQRVSRNAWEAFSESQLFIKPSVDTVCFRPDLPAGAIVYRDGGSAVNTYWEVKTSRIVGDPSPFINHLRKVYPNERDQAILMAFMAAVVQHKGKKFQWTPLLQGVEGNGKTLFTRCVAFAIGDRYTHFAKASQIAKNFNGWMANKIFIAVEDIYVADSQREVIEELKPMITGERIEVERKGVDQVTMEVCCNFILNSNHKDGIRKTANDRRFAQFYSAQQTKDDLARDGMTGNYFPKLYDWLKNNHGYEIVNEYLSTYEIPDELNPAHGHIAPITSSTNEALRYGLGRIEQEVLEAIDRGDSGFRGGWISSMALDTLLERVGSSRGIAPNKRREILLNLGYDYHPALHDGRLNNSVLPDGGKPRLYVHRDNVALRLITTPADVSRMYSMAQTVC
jgi:hypothetical protein